MAKKQPPQPPEPTLPPDHELWVCEGCWHIFYGADPPNECDWCGHEYFDNYADLAAESSLHTKH